MGALIVTLSAPGPAILTFLESVIWLVSVIDWPYRLGSNCTGRPVAMAWPMAWRKVKRPAPGLAASEVVFTVSGATTLTVCTVVATAAFAL